MDADPCVIEDLSIKDRPLSENAVSNAILSSINKENAL